MNFNYRKYLPALFAGVFFISSLLISIHKINELYWLHFISPLSILYFLFLFSLGALLLLWKKNKLSAKNFFLSTLASEIVLLVTSQIPSEIHYIFNILTGAWILALGYYLIIKRHKKQNRQKKQGKIAKLNAPVVTEKVDSKKKNFVFGSIFLIVIVLIHFWFGIFNLDKEAFSDEKLWTYGSENRIEDYWKNIFAREWENTRPSDKPGVTLAIISGIGLLWESPSAFFDNIEDKEALLKMLFAMRLPVVIFGTLMLGVFFWVIKRLTETKTALAATAFIGLSPILVGISHIVNPDALIYIFVPLALFCYLIYEKENKLSWLYLTGLFLGLGLLTKYISNLLVVFFFLSIFTSFILKEKNDQKIANFMREKLLDYATLIFIAVSVFYILYPGTWMKLDRVLLGTIWSQPFEPIWELFLLVIFAVVVDLVFFKSRAVGWLSEQKRKFRFTILLFVPTIFLLASLFVFWNTYQDMYLIDFQEGLSSPKSHWRDAPFGIVQTFLSGFYALFFAISPLAALGLLSGLLLTIWSIIKRQNSWRVIIFWQVSLFCLIYYAGSAFSLVGPIVRYQIVIYPLALMLAGIGIVWLLETVLKYFSQKQKQLKTLFAWVAIFLIIIFQSLTLWNIKPYFFSYNSYLLPEPFLVNPKDMGDGNYRVAEFLNELPNAEKLKVWSDNNGVCVLFVGECVTTITRTAFLENGPDYDYYVISNGRKERSTRTIISTLEADPNYDFRLDRLYETDNFLLEITPGKRSENFIRIIKGDAVVVFEGEDEKE